MVLIAFFSSCVLKLLVLVYNYYTSFSQHLTSLIAPGTSFSLVQSSFAKLPISSSSCYIPQP